MTLHLLCFLHELQQSGHFHVENQISYIWWGNKLANEHPQNASIAYIVVLERIQKSCFAWLYIVDIVQYTVHDMPPTY